MENNKDVTNLFWTGGWDSTFRLLQLLLIEKKEVQPFYVKFPPRITPDNIVPPRKSTEIEIRVMDRIRRKLFRDYPYTKELLQPTHYVDAADFKPGKAVRESYRHIKNEKHIGQQYEVLAAFADRRGINNLELSIESGGHSYEVLKPFIIKEPSSGIYQIDKSRSSKPVYHLYKDFRFPLLKYTKNEMAEIAKKEKWTSIMKMTWFCHRPYFGKYPCGACNPCISSHKNGMAWRMPWFSRVFGKTIKKNYNSKLMVNLRSIF